MKIQAVHRAIDILEFVSACHPREVTLGETARALGLHAATCANLMKTLVERNYVAKAYLRKTYILGPAAFALPGGRYFRNEIVCTAKQAVDALAADTHSACVLVVPFGGKIFVAYGTGAWPGEQGQHRHHAIWIDDVLAKPSARVLLAYMPTDARERYLRIAYGGAMERREPGRPNDLIDTPVSGPRRIHRELDEIRNRGYDQLQTEGWITAVAVPLTNGQNIVASLGLFLPFRDFAVTDGSEARVHTSLQNASRLISGEYTIRNIAGDLSA